MFRNLLTIAAAAFLLTLAAPTASADNAPPSKSAKSGKSKKAGTKKAGNTTKSTKSTKSKSKSKSKSKKSTKAKGKKSKARKSKGKSASNAQPKKTKNIIFGEGDDLEGSLDLPTGDDYTAKGAVGHSSLIRTRAHFIPEILKQAEKM